MSSDWKTYLFQELCDITRGASPRPIHDFLGDEGMPWIKIADATAEPSRFMQSTKERIKLNGVRASVEVFPGDLILSNSATPGLPKFLKINACIHDGWMLLRNFKNLDKEFAYWLLLTERTRLVAQGNGSVFTNLKTDILKNHPVTIPPIAMQRTIARTLNTLDDRIALLRETNATLEAIAQAMFKSWFVDFDPVHANATLPSPRGRGGGGEGNNATHHPHPSPLPAGEGVQSMSEATAALFPDSFEESELGLVPRGWKHSTVGQSFILTMGQSPPGDTYNSLAEGLPFYQGRTDFGLRFPTKRIFCNAPTRTAEVGDTLVSVRAPVGDVNMAIERCCLGRGVASVRHPLNYRSFAFYTIRGLRSKFDMYDSEGTVFGSINKKDFQALPVIEPTQEVLKAFDDIAAPLDSRIVENEEIMRNLATLRDTLLPRLISGQLRLPEAEENHA